MKDLHAAKRSHLTVPIKKGIEIHLDKSDKPRGKPKVGGKAIAHIPMTVTSVDQGHSRYKQLSKLKMELVESKIKKVSEKIRRK